MPMPFCSDTPYVSFPFLITFGSSPSIVCREKEHIMNVHAMFRIFLLIGSVAWTQSIVCPPDICKGLTCEPVFCRGDEVLEQKGGFCGCCDLCVRYLGEGDPCMDYIRGVVRHSRCSINLVCISGRCERPSQ